MSKILKIEDARRMNFEYILNLYKDGYRIENLSNLMSDLSMTSGVINPQIPCQYLITMDGNTTVAKNGLTGEIDYSNTDFSTTINNAINSLPIQGGKLYLHPGNYNIPSGSSGIQLIDSSIPSTKQFVLEGPGAILNNYSTNPAIILQAQNSVIRDLKIIGNGSNSGNSMLLLGTPAGTGGANNNELSNIRMSKNNIGLQIIGGVYNTLVNNCDIRGNRSHGIQLMSGTIPGSPTIYPPNKTTFNNCNTINNNGDGIRLDAGHACSINNCECDMNNYGIYLNTANNLITNCYIEANKSGTGVYGDTGALRTVIIGQSFFDTIPLSFANPYSWIK